MKNIYESPNLDIIELIDVDVITSSGGFDGVDDIFDAV